LLLRRFPSQPKDIIALDTASGLQLILTSGMKSLELLNDRVIPFVDQHQNPLLMILTDRVPSFVENWMNLK
jgi:hypothetical protein